MTTLLTVLTILLMGILSVFGGFIFGVYMTLMYSPYDGTLSHIYTKKSISPKINK